MVRANEENTEGLFGEPVGLEEAEQELELEDAEAPSTLAEEEEVSPHESSIQTGLRYLNPRYPDKRLNDLLHSAQVSRVFPDHFWAKHRLLVTSLVEEYAEDGKDVDIVGIVSMSEDALSIAFEGRNRVEILEALGLEHEEELEKLSKSLGIPL